MSELHELYQQLIIDHGRKPRNFGVLAGANYIKEGVNPLCGDKLIVYVVEKDGLIENLQFVGEGCAISTASASLMTQYLKGKTLEEAKHIFHDFHALVTQGDINNDPNIEARLGKLMVLKGVCEYPARVKCATLCWHTLMAALENRQDPVSTE